MNPESSAKHARRASGLHPAGRTFRFLVFAAGLLAAQGVRAQEPVETAAEPAEPVPADTAPESAEPAPPESSEDSPEPYAQTIPVQQTPESPGITGEGDPAQLDDIVVTATKREQSVREIPGSVSALTGEQLERIGARDQEDFIKFAPGVSLFKVEPNQQRITIRGIAQDFGTSQTAGTLIGDVPFTDPFVADLSPDLSPFDLQTVEILKGPQGTLFGGSGLGGSVRYVLAPAQVDLWETRGFVAYDSVAHGQSEPTYGLAVNAPLFRDDLGLRLTGTQHLRPGVVDELRRAEPDVDHSEQTSWRGQLRYAPTTRLDVQALHLDQEMSTYDLGFVQNLDGQLERDANPTPSPAVRNFGLDTLNVSYDFDWAQLVSVTGRVEKLFDLDADSSYIAPHTRVRGHVTVDGWTQELRLVSPADGGPWQWLGGVFLMRYDNFRRAELLGDPSTAPGDEGLVARFDLDATAEELAGFGEVTRTLGTRWDATAGLRAYRTRSEGVATASGPLNLLLTGEQESRNDASIREQDLNPKIAVRFHAADDVMLYGLASKGFRFGGIALIGDTPTDNVPETYKSDRLWLYEAGLRSRWFERSLTIDAAVYRIDWSEPQITQITDSGLLSYIDNVGGARVLGSELALHYLTPIDGLSLSTAAAYTDARTTEVFTAASGTEVPEGARWPFSARVQVSSSAGYVTYLGAWMLTGAAVHTYMGKGVANIENTVPVFDYQTLDARIQLANPGWKGAPELSLAATNLLDERGVASRTETSTARVIYYVRPRATSLQLTFRF